ncbi:hypothetical protein BCV70DRAFT_200549 [Testicularia cyperi]|uniref:Phosphatidylethanolamine N-methyltransferase n=1 Tax=Testicularia cyperi TaxID=1882483 RepID=A0A317XMW7_9BASI|nr:hypothetical protein BCV70DRAFT_200549 [Testicularia cyperi]
MSSLEALDPTSAQGLRNRLATAAKQPSSSNTPDSSSTPTDSTTKDHALKSTQPPASSSQDDPAKVLGRTPDGTVFSVPHTPDMLSSIFDPRQPKTPLDIVTVVSLALQILLYFSLSRTSAKLFFLVYFAFWRGSYNLGLGWILKQQSETGYIIRKVKQNGWMDAKRRPKVHAWVRQQLVTKMDADYSFEATPLDYNVWLMFRSIVDVILLNDFVAYSLFAFSCTRLPEGHSTAMHLLRWIAGWTLIFFNLWVKVDAHRVVKDYAWYWGDCFFLCLQSLVFDGVYEIAPDPMYSIGYAGYYGLSLVSGSYAVLFVSLAAHFCQFLFMTFFEGPHIERTYGERKPIAARVPLRQAPFNAASRKAAHGPIEQDDDDDLSGPSSPKLPPSTFDKSEAEFDAPTPSQTEGSTALTTTDDEANTTEDDEDRRRHEAIKRTTLRTASSSNDAIQRRLSDINESRDQLRRRSGSLRSSAGMSAAGVASNTASVLTLHDLHHRIFRKDTVVFRNLDLMRGNDFLLVVGTAYALFPLLLPTVGHNARLALLFCNALIWRTIHSLGLGAALSRQSESKWIVRHFLKHYHYSQPQDAIFEAFANWKVIYNTSLVMTYVSFGALAWNCYTPIGHPDWTVGPELLRHTLGFLLVALHVWTANSSYDVLGPFGWLYGDFFVDEYPHQLYYTGIYRFLNNPERSMGGAAFFGLALIAGSKLVLTMAIVSYIAHWGFLSFVEGPHMRKLYGEAALRKDSGVTKQLKSQWGAARHSDLFRAAQEHPTIKNVQGTLEKVQRDAAEAFEEFFKQSKPRFEGMLEDTKLLLQQSRDRLLIVRVEDDEKLRSDGVDKSKYSLEVRPSATPSASTSTSSGAGAESGLPRFHLGEPITVEWTAAPGHSRRDWIGVYLLSRFGGKQGADQASLVTKISSQGKWLGVAEREWEGDVHTARTSAVGLGSDGRAKHTSTDVRGRSVFRDDRLPWVPGTYEFRYHHDGKHNVLARSGPLEIYVDKAPVTAAETVADKTQAEIAAHPEELHAREQDELDQTCNIIRRIVHFSTPTTRPHRLSIATPANQSGAQTPNLDDAPSDKDTDTPLVPTFSSGSHAKANPSDNTDADADTDTDTETDTGSPQPEPFRNQEEAGSDPDDFPIWNTTQAKRISIAISHAFDIELSPEVIIAEANVRRLAMDVVHGRRVLSPGFTPLMG